MSTKTVITISREYGSGGRDIGRLIAEKLKIPCYDEEITKMAAEESGLSREILKENDETASGGMLGSFMAGSYFFAAPVIGQPPISDRLFLLESEIIHRLAQQGPCVLVGRCANYILKDFPNALHVFIRADLTFRKQRAVEHYGIPEKKIEEFLHKQDKHRAHYRSFYTDQNWKSIENYDLIANSSAFGMEGCAELIIRAAELKK